MSSAQDLAKKLQITPGTGLWVWPNDATADAVESASHVERRELADADVAVLFTDNKAAVDTVLTEYLEGLAELRAVWIVYAKGNKTDINRDSLWVQLADYGWKAVSQVSYDDALSALRIRPLKEGEASPV